MNSETKLLRQINPSWIEDGRPTSMAFTPSPKDEGRLSVYDGDQIDAADSWRHFTEVQGLASIGVLAVTVAECEEESVQPQADPEPFEEHAVIDFNSLSGSQAKKVGRRLRDRAMDRGWLFRPNAN